MSKLGNFIIYLILCFRLQEINFGDCLLKTRGAIALAEALQDEHKQLGVLNLSFNEIRADGGYAVAMAVENKPLLEILDLNGNMVRNIHFL